MPGVSAVERSDGLAAGPEGPHYLRCRVEGDVGPFLAAIADAGVEDLTVPDLGATGAPSVTNRFVEEKTGPSLDDAAIVVAGGRGLGRGSVGRKMTGAALAAP